MCSQHPSDPATAEQAFLAFTDAIEPYPTDTVPYFGKAVGQGPTGWQEIVCLPSKTLGIILQDSGKQTVSLRMFAPLLGWIAPNARLQLPPFSEAPPIGLRLPVAPDGQPLLSRVQTLFHELLAPEAVTRLSAFLCLGQARFEHALKHSLSSNTKWYATLLTDGRIRTCASGRRTQDFPLCAGADPSVFSVFERMHVLQSAYTEEDRIYKPLALVPLGEIPLDAPCSTSAHACLALVHQAKDACARLNVPIPDWIAEL